MMNKLLLAAAVALSIPACVADDSTDTTGLDMPTDVAFDQKADGATTAPIKRIGDGPDSSVCAYLPHDDSACAHACDPEGLLAFIPEGTCTTFACELSNGDQYVTGGCNW